MGWKPAVTKKLLHVAVWRILAPEALLGASMDIPWAAVRDTEAYHLRYNTLQTKTVNKANEAFKFRIALPQSGSKK